MSKETKENMRESKTKKVKEDNEKLSPNLENDRLTDETDLLFAFVNIEEIEKKHCTPPHVNNNNLNETTRNKRTALPLQSSQSEIVNYTKKNKISPSSSASEVDDSFDKYLEGINKDSQDVFKSIHSEGLSQLEKSSHFKKQLETALLQCESKNTSPVVSQLNSDKQSVELFTDSEPKTDNFSLSSSLEDKNTLEKLNQEVIEESEELFKDYMGENLKTQIATNFDFLETSIIQNENTSLLDINWEETMNKSGLSRSVLPEKHNNTINQINWDETMIKSAPEEERDPLFVELGTFYGLPNHVRTLLKDFKGIGSLYDWQDECLRLPSVAKRKNLVYSLPTSGGKTLVSEILIFREILCRKKNALLVLPYVALVQEKLWTLSPFGVALNFLVEEYAAGKGSYPPRKRRHKRTLYVATIEKALGLVNSLVEKERLNEIGLVVVDELHLIGEEGRGNVLEILLTKLLISKQKIQIIGMSATIGNLPEICKFLHAELFTKDFRPVELEEYICCGDEIARHTPGQELQVKKREDGLFYNENMKKIDPNRLGGLVLEVIPEGSCLVFCASKKNCENVAVLLTKVLPKEQLLNHKSKEKTSIMKQIESEGALCPVLQQTLPYGVAYHHSGLTGDDRKTIEEAFRAGVLCVICCTSTLAAGVNLPAQRVILRSPYVGLDFISLSRYKQMVGRAGRAGYSEVGQSILVCEKKDLPKVINLLASPMDEAVSQLPMNDLHGLKNLLLSSITLHVAETRKDLQAMAAQTLMAVQEDRFEETVKRITDSAIVDLFRDGALQLNEKLPPRDAQICMETTIPDAGTSFDRGSDIIVRPDAKITISKLGNAAIKAGLDLKTAHQLFEDLVKAQTGLVLVNGLHLLYLITPYDYWDKVKPQPQDYYDIYNSLGPKELKTAQAIGITEACIIGLINGQKIKAVPDKMLNRFFLTLILYALWQGRSIPQVANKFQVTRGLLQQLMTSSSTFSNNVLNFCSEINDFWPFACLLQRITQRLQYCCSRELLPLMELPAVKVSRAKQLYMAGYSSLQLIAKAHPAQLARDVDHLSRKVAAQLVAAAKMLLLEKVENLREEAEDVLEGLMSDT